MLPDDNIGSTNKYGIRTSNAISYSRVVGEPLEAYLQRAKLISEELESRSGVHISPRTWFTHKLVGGCWICDEITFGRILLRELDYLWEEYKVLAKYADEKERTALENQVPIGDDGPQEETNI